jgi:hypothetical protein
MKFHVSFLALVSVAWAATHPPQDPRASPAPIQYGEGRELCKLAHPDIDESSGVACSRRTPSVFWTHNDSGDPPRLFAFSARGQVLGIYTVEGTVNHDWEDMASFSIGGRSYLLIADVGDNSGVRGAYTLYVVPEPAVDLRNRADRISLKASLTIGFRYEDGAHNCEGVAIDPTARIIFLVSKCAAPECKVYALPLPRESPREPLVAKPIAVLKLPVTTAMDISPDGLRAIVLTYGDAFEYARRPGETWSDAFARRPRTIPMPPRRQGEALCYGPDGRTLYLTSEGSPMPFLEVPVVEPR